MAAELREVQKSRKTHHGNRAQITRVFEKADGLSGAGHDSFEAEIPPTSVTSYSRGREAGERREGREISRRVKTPSKGPIVFSPFRHLAFGQPTKFRVDRLGDRD